MRLFKRARNQPQAISLSLIELCDDGYCTVVGESHYQDALRLTSTICTPSEEGRPAFQAVLVPEPNNEYDGNAVAVYSTHGKLGYLSRENALEYREVFAEVRGRGADGGACRAFLNGGSPDKPSYGVTLLLASADRCLRDLRSSS
jgi:hypothetical protein